MLTRPRVVSVAYVLHSMAPRRCPPGGRHLSRQSTPWGWTDFRLPGRALSREGSLTGAYRAGLGHGQATGKLHSSLALRVSKYLECNVSGARRRYPGAPPLRVGFLRKVEKCAAGRGRALCNTLEQRGGDIMGFGHDRQRAAHQSLVVAVCLCLGSCDPTTPAEVRNGQDGGPPAVVLTGAAEKGPLILGSSVSVIAVNARGEPTGRVFQGETTSNLGTFELEVNAQGPLALQASGFYFNEVTGALSRAPLTLRGWYDLGSATGQTANINVITHLANRRVRALLHQSVALDAAIEQAESELVQAVGLARPSMLSRGTSQGLLDSAYLFGLSAVLAEAGRARGGVEGADSSLQELLNALAVDLEDDGQLQEAAKAELRAAEDSLVPERVTANLSARMMELGQTGSPPDLDQVLDSDLDGLVNANDNCSERANPDQADKNGDGVGDACCGNSKREGAEECDDGARVDGDGCDARCRDEGPYMDGGVAFDAGADDAGDPLMDAGPADAGTVPGDAASDGSTPDGECPITQPSVDGGTCLAGKCPVVLAGCQDTPYDIATDGTNVYWTNLAGTVMKCAVDGCDLKPTTFASDQQNPTGIALTGVSLAWLSGGLGSVLACPLTGCDQGPTSLAAFPGGIGLAADADGLYWTQFGPDAIRAIQLSGGDAETIASATSPGWIAVDESALYWAGWNTQGLTKVDKNKGNLKPLATGRVMRVAVDATYVYWTASDGPEPTDTGSVFRANKDGSGAVPLVSGVPAPNGIATDGAHVYWTMTNGATFPEHPSIARCAIAGCGGVAEVMARGQNGPFQITVDTANVYWTNSSDGTVMGLSK